MGKKFVILIFLLFVSCHMIIGLEKKDLPRKDANKCQSNADCNDGKDCTSDQCDTRTGTCINSLSSSEFICRSAKGVCDIEERCDGVNPECPPDSVKPSTEVCRPSISLGTNCDPEERCTGDSAECPQDVIADEGEPCNDGDDCTYGDVCDGQGQCAGENGLSSITYFSASGSGSHVCAVLSQETAKCWGKGNDYQLGNGDALNRNYPVNVSGLPDNDTILQISSGGNHTCILLRSGRIFCWGGNESGQLGNGSNDSSAEPVEVKVDLPSSSNFPAWDFVSAGLSYTCAIHRYHGVYCWGANEKGQLGSGTTNDENKPVSVNDVGYRFVRVQSGFLHTCGVTDNGSVFCWGDNLYGQLGNASVGDFSSTPVMVEGLDSDAKAIEVSTGSRHTCALLDNGNVMCWGDSGRGQIGRSGATGGPVPEQVNLSEQALTESDIFRKIIYSGENHTCVLLSSGKLACWGAGDSGQLGDGYEVDRFEPVFVEGLPSNPVSISCGSNFSCVVSSNTTIACWGNNDYGQLGNGNDQKSLVPVQVICQEE